MVSPIGNRPKELDRDHSGITVARSDDEADQTPSAVGFQH